LTNPGDIADVIRSTWPDVELSAAQERLYAEYLRDIDPTVLRSVLAALVADWDHPTPPGIIRAAAGEQAERTKRKKTWIHVGLVAGIFVLVLGGMLAAAAVMSGGGTRTPIAATGAIAQPRNAQPSTRHVAPQVAARKAVPARPCSSYYDAVLDGTATIEFGGRGKAAGPYSKTPPDPSGINCTGARRVIRDFEAGKGTSVHGRDGGNSYTVVDGWKCATSTEATGCSKGNLSFIVGTRL